MSEEDQKRIIKEAIKEWMDEKFAMFGRWSFIAVSSAVLSAVVLFWLHYNK